MAIFRKIHTSFWSDTFIQDLDNDHKLFYLYLLTNERTKQCGIYEISKKQISFDLGYSIDRVSKLLKYFIDTNRIMYSEPTKELALRNWTKFNGSTSPKVVSCIKSELLNVKDRVLIEYVNGMYTASQEEQEQEEEEEEEKNNNKFDFKKSLLSFGFNSDLVSEWLKVRKKKGLTNSEVACKDFIKQVELNGQDKNYILEQCVIKSWGGFKSEWLPKQNNETNVTSISQEEFINSFRNKF
ncbi:hypothetical protein UFOVP603_44 [uncultured Caudovirales phage]|uniref:Uncharacterized protein n=1 Tax=uncultured Caudovirales phage TaxID=2100421 RepID=A0A6J5N7S1_9CAUD|nr:hypothetical protein UFOVP603_44 [uncultured Caudovirales phage]